MKFANEFVAKAMQGSAREAAELAPVIRKCAVAGASKANGISHAEDIEQELWVFLIKHGDRLNDEFNIEPYLIETARKMTLAFKRKFSLYGTEGSEDTRTDGLADMSGFEVSTEQEAVEGLIDRTQQQQAMEALLMASPALRAAANHSDQVQPGENQMRNQALPKEVRRKLSPEQKELRKIRLETHLTQSEMAAKIGCKLPTYQAYEYGKTVEVNPKIMEAARKLKVNPDFSYVDKLYKRKSMAAIAAGWSKRLGIPVGHLSELARIVGVDKATIHRWYDPKSTSRPDMEMMAVYERRVNAEEKYILQSGGAVAAKKRAARRTLN